MVEVLVARLMVEVERGLDLGRTSMLRKVAIGEDDDLLVK